MKQSLKVALFIVFLVSLAAWSARAQVVVKQTDTIRVVHDTVWMVDTVVFNRPSVQFTACNYWPDCSYRYPRPYYGRPMVLMPFNGHVYRPDNHARLPLPWGRAQNMPNRERMMNQPNREGMMNRPATPPRPAAPDARARTRP